MTFLRSPAILEPFLARYLLVKICYSLRLKILFGRMEIKSKRPPQTVEFPEEEKNIYMSCCSANIINVSLWVGFTACPIIAITNRCIKKPL